MPSSNKTKNLRLNRWRGADKPKMDDFNSDNLIIDRAIQDILNLLATEYVVTIQHNLNHMPVGTLYSTEYATGICGAGEGLAGGGDVKEIQSRIRIVDSQTIDVFTIPEFSGIPEIIATSENTYHLVFPHSAISLILILR